MEYPVTISNIAGAFRVADQVAGPQGPATFQMIESMARQVAGIADVRAKVHQIRSVCAALLAILNRGQHGR